MTVGLYLNNLDEDYQIGIFKGIRDRAAERGIDLFCLQGNELEHLAPNAEDLFPSHRLVRTDGVIILSSVLMNRIDAATERAVSQLFRDRACIAVGCPTESYPSIIIRTRSSMKALMHHLVMDHGYRSFLYIGGAVGHRDSDLRQRIFTSYLSWFARRSPSIRQAVRNGDINEASALRMTSEYIAKHPDDPPDVIVAANDNMAIGVLKAIRAHGGSAWRDCAVTGFDDIPRARHEIPALTTIRQPLYQLGMTALDAIESLMTGQRLPQRIHIDSSLCIRASCGCAGFIQQVDANKESGSEEGIPTNDAYNPWLTRQSETLLRCVSILGQRLIRSASLEELVMALRDFLSDLDVHNFHLLLYSENCSDVPDDAWLIYQKEGKREKVQTDLRDRVMTASYIKDMSADSRESHAVCLFPLDSGDEHLGLVIYEALDHTLPHLCSSAVFLANTVKRIRLLEREKARSRQLEQRVALRTSDLVEANRKLRKEAARRRAVEAEVLKISELERQRFSLDLHDDICQRLAGISMYCKSMADTAAMKDLSQMIDETLQRTRQYAHDSFPMDLDTLGLKDALGALCNDTERQTGSRVSYEWEAGEQSPLSSVQDINVYRIAQEAMQNVLKHAKASEVQLRVRCERETFVVEIEDNGTGSLELERALGLHDLNTLSPRGRRGTGLGLRSMQYRAHQIGAEFSIHSVPGKGTMVILVLPLAEAPASAGGAS